MKITTGKQKHPRRVMLYGVHGVGKSTWAAQAPEVLFLNIEDGLSDIDCTATEPLKKLSDLKAALQWLTQNEHAYKWIVIDTLDWLEQIIFQQVADDAGKPSIADIGYGAGYKQAVTKWNEILGWLDFVRKSRGVGVIALAHTAIKRFDSPEMDAYDRYQPALHDLASALWQEWCDEVLFASYRVYVRKEDQGFNKERAIAVGDGERYLRTRETAAVMAKNRLGLPPEMPFTWDAYAEHLSKRNIEGVVIDGSSKPKPQTKETKNNG